MREDVWGYGSEAGSTIDNITYGKSSVTLKELCQIFQAIKIVRRKIVPSGVTSIKPINCREYRVASLFCRNHFWGTEAAYSSFTFQTLKRTDCMHANTAQLIDCPMSNDLISRIVSDHSFYSSFLDFIVQWQQVARKRWHYSFSFNLPEAIATVLNSNCPRLWLKLPSFYPISVLLFIFMR